MTVLIIISMTFYYRICNILQRIKHIYLISNLKMLKKSGNNYNYYIIKHPVSIFHSNYYNELTLIAHLDHVDQDGHLRSISLYMTTKIDNYTPLYIYRHIKYNLFHNNHCIRQYWAIFHFFFYSFLHGNLCKQALATFFSHPISENPPNLYLRYRGFCQQTRGFKCTILRYQLNLNHTILCYGYIFNIHKKLKISK